MFGGQPIRTSRPSRFSRPACDFQSSLADLSPGSWEGRQAGCRYPQDGDEPVTGAGLAGLDR
jgi:hypothetical protein